MECLFGCSRNNSKNKNNKKRSSYNPNTNNTNNTKNISKTSSNKPKSSNNNNNNDNENVNVNIKPKPSDHVTPSKTSQSQSHDPTRAPCPDASQPPHIDNEDQRLIPVEHGHGSSKARTFSYQELVDATDNFRCDSLLGEGGFGKVFKGHLPHTNQPVAIKQLDRNGLQGIREFVVEVLTLSLADHPNLVKLIGYCAEGSQRLLVYEYMPLGSLETHLHDLRPNQRPLDWDTRMKIAAGAAMGLEYLHDQMKPPVIYRDLKCSNILLGPDYHPKLSDFGLAKVGPVGDKTHVSTRVMGTYGYCAPDYAMTGQLTFKSDIYSFGVVLLEIITGRKAIDNTKDSREQNLVAWAKPLFKDRKKFSQMADPALGGQYPTRGLYQALAIAAMCVQEQPSMRPLIADIVTALKYLASHKYDPQMHSSSTHHRRNPSSLRSTKDYSNKPESADSKSEDEAD